MQYLRFLLPIAIIALLCASADAGLFGRFKKRSRCADCSCSAPVKVSGCVNGQCSLK